MTSQQGAFESRGCDKLGAVGKTLAACKATTLCSQASRSSIDVSSSYNSKKLCCIL